MLTISAALLGTSAWSGPHRAGASFVAFLVTVNSSGSGSGSGGMLAGMTVRLACSSSSSSGCCCCCCLIHQDVQWVCTTKSLCLTALYAALFDHLV
jgi:hypothetical protein